MRLRQLALVAEDLEQTAHALTQVFSLGEPFRDPGVATFGLANTVFALGDCFLEVVSPVADGTTAGRQLARRGGPGGYMVIVQVDDLATERQRVEQLGVRVAWEIDLGQAATVHLHPRDLGGALLSLDQMTPPASWEWGGPGWEQRRGEEQVSAIRAVVIQAENPAAMAERWGQVLTRPVSPEADGYAVTLDEGRVIFVPIDRDRTVEGEGIIGMELATDHAPGILEAARECGLPVEGKMLQLAGVDFRLVG
jgi:hypothetical protein